jgi:hypothetical protein
MREADTQTLRLDKHYQNISAKPKNPENGARK